MSARILGASVIVLVLAVVLPYAYVTWIVYVPELTDAEASHQAAVLEVDDSIHDLRSREPASERELADSRSELHRVRGEHLELSSSLETSLATETSAERELERSKDEATALEQQIHAVDEELASDAAREMDLRAESGSVGAEVDELSDEISDLQHELDWTLETTERLAEERRDWEGYETFHSIPRASLYGVAGWSQDGLSGGIDAGAWLFRPRNQRLGLRAGYFVHSDQKDSYGFVGVAWQRLLPRRLHLDVWAGGLWSERTPQSEAPFDPAAGMTFGMGVPKLPLGVGVTALISPDETLFGFAVGYTQVAQAADLYGRR